MTGSENLRKLFGGALTINQCMRIFWKSDPCELGMKMYLYEKYVADKQHANYMLWFFGQIL